MAQPVVVRSGSGRVLHLPGAGPTTGHHFDPASPKARKVRPMQTSDTGTAAQSRHTHKSVALFFQPVAAPRVMRADRGPPAAFSNRPSRYGALQAKFAASLVLPAPW